MAGQVLAFLTHREAPGTAAVARVPGCLACARDRPFSAFPARRSGRQSAGSAGPRRQFPVAQAGIKGNLPRFQIGPGAGLLALRYALRCVSAIAFPPDQRACSACAASATSLLPIFYRSYPEYLNHCAQGVGLLRERLGGGG